MILMARKPKKRRKIFAYKVVRAIGFGDAERLYSARIENRYIRVLYTPRQWAKPNIKDSMLMVFRDRSMALSFANYRDQVWKVEVQNLRQLPIMTFSSGNTATFRAFWACTKRLKGVVLFFRNGFQNVTPTPYETYCTTRLKLVEKIKG